MEENNKVHSCQPLPRRMYNLTQLVILGSVFPREEQLHLKWANMFICLKGSKRRKGLI